MSEDSNYESNLTRTGIQNDLPARISAGSDLVSKKYEYLGTKL